MRHPHRFRRAVMALAVIAALAPGAALAIDPPYQGQMERLAEIMGSLYFLTPLCSASKDDWRQEVADLIALDQPDEDRQQRLYGAFNGGYTAYSRLYRECTDSASEAMTRLLVEAEKTARDIHSRYAE